MSIERRVEGALVELAERGLGSVDGFTIHMGIGAWRDLIRERGSEAPSLWSPVLVTPNLNLADGEIVLRYEVTA